MRKIKQILKSRQGIAIENAVAFMLVIFLLCALITGLTTLGHYQAKLENLTLQQKAEIDQIGEDYIASVKAGDFEGENVKEYSPDYSGNKYTCYKYANTLSVWHTDDAKKAVVLYIEHNDDGTITKWCYSNP